MNISSSLRARRVDCLVQVRGRIDDQIVPVNHWFGISSRLLNIIRVWVFACNAWVFHCQAICLSLDEQGIGFLKRLEGKLPRPLMKESGAPSGSEKEGYEAALLCA